MKPPDEGVDRAAADGAPSPTRVRGLVRIVRNELPLNLVDQLREPSNPCPLDANRAAGPADSLAQCAKRAATDCTTIRLHDDRVLLPFVLGVSEQEGQQLL